MSDTSRYTIEERLIISVLVHVKEWTGKTYEEIRDFFFRFNKAAPRETNLQEAPTSQDATTACGPT